MRPGYRMLCEVAIDLLLATTALRLRSFEAVVAGLKNGHGRQIDRHEAKLLERALAAWDRRMPWRTRCFEQGLAAMRYLDRHGYAGTLHYGARGAGEALRAHVWVTSGETDVVGTDNAGDYHVLARFPSS